MIVVAPTGTKHIVELRVESRGRAYGAVTHEDDMLALLHAGRMAVDEDVADTLAVVDAIEQRRAHADGVEEGAQLVNVAAQQVHLLAVDDEGGLDDQPLVALATQAEKGLNGCILTEAALSQPLHDDA